MVTHGEAPARGARINGAGSLLKQTLLFVLTLVVGVTIVVMIGMVRRDQFESRMRARRTGVASSTFTQLVTDYLSGLVQGRFSGADAPATEEKLLLRQISICARQSLQLLGITLAFALPIGLLWGAFMAWQHGTRFGTLLEGINTIVLAVPSFVVLLVMIISIATITLRTGVRLAYTQGYGIDRHLIVPVTVLALRGAAYFAQVVALAQREVADHEWVRYARAKGLGGLRLWRNHILPLLTLPLLGGLLGTLRVVVGAQLLVEFLYNWGGLSKLLLPIGSDGTLSLRQEPIEIAALVLLVIFFVLTDGLGRLALWGVGAQRHERGSAV